MIELIHYLDKIDTSILLYLNGFHNEFWDYFMTLYSGRFIWIPFYASFLYVMLRNYPLKSNILCLVFIALTITLCDQTASALLKPLVERMRPSNLDNPISAGVHVAFNYRGGRYGFPSSHAANSWSMAFFAIFLAKRKKLSIFLLVWAVLMSYTRIYLGVHYPGDLLVGILIGLVWAYICYQIFLHIQKGKYANVFAPTDKPLKHGFVPFAVGGLSIAGMLIASAIMLYTK